MNRAKIGITLIYKVTKRFASTLKAKKLPIKGRPKVYDESIFLTILLVRELTGYSYREAILAVKRELRIKKMPALSTIHYRISTMSKRIIIKFNKFLVNKLIKSKLPRYIEDIYVAIVDGTGFSFNDLYPLRIYRGKEVRMVKSHVKLCVIIGVTVRGERVILGISSGDAYSSEIKLVRDALEQAYDVLGIRAEGMPFVGDKGYDSVRFMERLRELGFIPVIKVREGRLRGVRNELRMESKREADKEGGVYRRRVLIESLFGTLKSKLGVHIYAKRVDIAQKEAMMRIILWNIYLLASE